MTQAIKSPNCQLQTFNISDNSFEDDAVLELGLALQENLGITSVNIMTSELNRVL